MTINVPNYGNCYVFNTALNPNDSFGGLRVTSLTGPAFGLSMVISLEQHNYMRGGQSKQAGARMVVHPSGLYPLVDEMGQDLFPSTLSHASVQLTNLQRQPWPYTSDCISSWHGTNYSFMAKRDLVPYSLSVSLHSWLNCKYQSDFSNDNVLLQTFQQCQRLCIVKMITRTCGCFHPLYADFEFVIERGQSPCNLTTECELKVEHKLHFEL